MPYNCCKRTLGGRFRFADAPSRLDGFPDAQCLYFFSTMPRQTPEVIVLPPRYNEHVKEPSQQLPASKGAPSSLH